MLASLLLALVGTLGTASTASTARASPVDGSPTRIASASIIAGIARTALSTAVSPLPTYSNFSLSCESIALFAPDVHEDEAEDTTENSETDNNETDKRLPDQLRARCLDCAGRFHTTTIDLNLCVGIDYQDASLQWSIYGKYSEYCSQCWAAGKGVEMGCACMPLTATKEIMTNSTLDLDLGIGNVNGTLYCTGGMGRKSG